MLTLESFWGRVVLARYTGTPVTGIHSNPQQKRSCRSESRFIQYCAPKGPNAIRKSKLMMFVKRVTFNAVELYSLSKRLSNHTNGEKSMSYNERNMD
ncbi:hypothetical protein PoB_001080100 [Plakobranchus ocellatus]|uniref:Uncharacterized protein n=1 Tax=Plakobranchus ocellatus TaxID=259542 RepID=A0AAV3YPF8_9GAST|nr:hypothetical protein PoB_001080100 [Plakobranchus ocellatus]